MNQATPQPVLFYRPRWTAAAGTTRIGTIPNPEISVVRRRERILGAYRFMVSHNWNTDIL